jgi:hypothetical protein
MENLPILNTNSTANLPQEVVEDLQKTYPLDNYLASTLASSLQNAISADHS